MGELLPRHERGNWKRVDDVLMPEPVAFAIHSMGSGKRTGQITLNFNEGKIQSFEVKEHTRI
jgi:hypothetical protein